MDVELLKEEGQQELKDLRKEKPPARPAFYSMLGQPPQRGPPAMSGTQTERPPPIIPRA